MNVAMHCDPIISSFIWEIPVSHLQSAGASPGTCLVHSGRDVKLLTAARTQEQQNRWFMAKLNQRERRKCQYKLNFRSGTVKALDELNFQTESVKALHHGVKGCFEKLTALKFSSLLYFPTFFCSTTKNVSSWVFCLVICLGSWGA